MAPRPASLKHQNTKTPKHLITHRSSLIVHRYQNVYININEFKYELPEDRIAQYPLAQRDASKLLCWRQGEIEHRVFRELPEIMSPDSVLFFNNTRVIPARMFFYTERGALIEVFVLKPVDPALVELAMRSSGPTTWECTIGGLRKWKDGEVLQRSLADGRLTLRLTLTDRTKMQVCFEWNDPQVHFAEIVSRAGEMPIPPYLRRRAEATDSEVYQTVYSKKEGAVAAPTAGLHFTPEVLAELATKGVRQEELTLHVSSGTFKPVKTENALEHDMHSEQVVLRRSNLEALALGRPVVAVGTTSMRTLESIYWFAEKLQKDPNAAFFVQKMDPYNSEATLTRQAAAQLVLDYMQRRNIEELYGETQIYIFPGYTFKMVDALITNFHQPGSTLMLLVAAFTGGGDAWKTIYQAALDNNYRFLSFGDSSFLTMNYKR